MKKIYYSQSEAMDKLGRCTVEKIRKLVDKGKIRIFRDGGMLMYRVDEVDKFAKELRDKGSLYRI